MELGQALEEVLGTNGVEELSLEDWNVVHYLTFGIDLAKQVLPLMADAGGDEAASSPATSVASTPCETGTLASPDELSLDRTPLGEGAGAEPANKVARMCQHGIRRLTQRVRDMAIDADRIEIPQKGPGQTPGAIGATLARGAQSSTTRTDSHPPAPPAICPEDVRREMQGGGDIPGGGVLPGCGGGGWGPPGGGSGGGGDELNKDVDMAPKEPEDKDPTVGHEGKVYTPRTTKRREMAQMFRDFCGLP